MWKWPEGDGVPPECVTHSEIAPLTKGGVPGHSATDVVVVEVVAVEDSVEGDSVVLEAATHTPQSLTGTWQQNGS